jgi:hypothetical protein
MEACAPALPLPTRTTELTETIIQVKMCKRKNLRNSFSVA